MKSRYLRFSILSVMLLTAVIAVAAMFYQRHVAWLAAQERFIEIVASDDHREDHTPEVRELVARFPGLVKRPGSMTYAVRHGDNALCRQFLEAGADPDDAESGIEPAPIFGPLIQDNDELVRLMIEHGADIHAGNRFDEKRTLLHLAAAWNSPKVCRLLIENGLDVNQTDSTDRTPLHDAAEIAEVDVIEALLEFDVESKKDSLGRTPYDIAKTKVRKYQGMQGELKRYNATVEKLKALDEASAK